MEDQNRFEHSVGKNTSPDVNSYLASKAPDLGVRVPDQTGSASSQFPIKLTHADPRDELMALKSSLLEKNAAAGGQNGVLKGVGLATATDADFQYFRDKELAERQGDFKRFFIENIRLDDPVYQDYYQRMYPQIFEERESLAEKQIEHQAHLMKINLRGPRNIEDWMFMYGIDRGFIQIPDGPIWDPAKLLATDFQGGLFSIRHILPRDSTAQNRFLPNTVGSNNPSYGSDRGFLFDWKNPVKQTDAKDSKQTTKNNFQIAPGGFKR